MCVNVLVELSYIICVSSLFCSVVCFGLLFCGCFNNKILSPLRRVGEERQPLATSLVAV